MKKFLITAMLAIPLFLAATGFAQDLSDTTTIIEKQIMLGTGPSNSGSQSIVFEKASGGYFYNGPGFGGRIFVGPNFRQTNRLARLNINNGIEHGNNLGLFPSGGNLGVMNPAVTTGTTIKYKSTMLRKGKLIKMRRTKRMNRMITS